MVFLWCVVCLVVGKHLIVDALGSQLGVQLAWTAQVIMTVEVVDAIGDVAGLLDFGKEATRADGMNTPGRQEEAVALLHRIARDGIDDGLFADHLLVLLGRDLLTESTEQGCIRLGRHEIPHLGLAALASLSVCNLIGGMHLNGEVVTGINELDEQRELIAKALVVGTADELFFQFGHEVVELSPCIGTFADDSLIAWHATDFPTLAYLAQLGMDVLERGYLRSAPDGVFEDRGKFEHI